MPALTDMGQESGRSFIHYKENLVLYPVCIYGKVLCSSWLYKDQPWGRTILKGKSKTGL